MDLIFVISFLFLTLLVGFKLLTIISSRSLATRLGEGEPVSSPRRGITRSWKAFIVEISTIRIPCLFVKKKTCLDDLNDRFIKPSADSEIEKVYRNIWSNVIIHISPSSLEHIPPEIKGNSLFGARDSDSQNATNDPTIEERARKKERKKTFDGGQIESNRASPLKGRRCF